MAIDKPKYKVLEKDGNIELREYKGYIVASVLTSAENYARAGNQGFSPLAGYIFGDNQISQKMPMTAPVITTQQSQSKKIPMTVPVLTEGMTTSKYKVSFVMPPSYKRKDLPIPNNSDVSIQEITKHRAVAISFSGITRESTIREKVAKLTNWAENNNIELDGKPMLARYDAPWKPGFLRHNEIIINCK